MTARERKRDSETDTNRQARPQDCEAGEEREGVAAHADKLTRESLQTEAVHVSGGRVNNSTAIAVTQRHAWQTQETNHQDIRTTSILSGKKQNKP